MGIVSVKPGRIKSGLEPINAALAAKICFDSCAICPFVGESTPFCRSHWTEIDHKLSPAKTRCWRITGAGLAAGAGTQVPERCAPLGLGIALLALALLPALVSGAALTAPDLTPPDLPAPDLTPPDLPPVLGAALAPGALPGALTPGVLAPGPPVRG